MSMQGFTRIFYSIPIQTHAHQRYKVRKTHGGTELENTCNYYHVWCAYM